MTKSQISLLISQRKKASIFGDSMKKLSQPTRKEYKMPRLYLDDLEKIEEIIKEVKPKDYKIKFRGYEYDELTEVPKDSESTEFHLQTYDPFLSLDLDNGHASLYMSDDNVTSRGIFSKVDEIILKRERKVLWLFGQLAVWIAAPIFLGFILVSIKLLRMDIFNIKGLSFLILALLSAYWWYFSFQLSMKSFSKIELWKEKDKFNFFLRNKDQIILLVLGAFLGAIATVFLERIFIK